MRLIDTYKNMTFKEKTVFNAKLSVYINGFLAFCKYIMAFFASGFMLAAANVNVLIMISKLECYLGEKHPEKKPFAYRNKMIGLMLLLAGVQYAIYMARLIFIDVDMMKYDMIMGIGIAFVSFVEIICAIIGCFRSYGKGHYYRNIKLISLCSALTAMVLTEIAIMSFASNIDYRFSSGIFGVAIGFLIVLIAIFILIAPRISIVDRMHNVYEQMGETDLNTEVKIKLTNSKFYGNYYYIGTKKTNTNIIDGQIVQDKSPIFKWNIYILILVIILSEILIFPYAIGALVYYFKNAKLIDKLDNIMLKHNYKKIDTGDEYD